MARWDGAQGNNVSGGRRMPGRRLHAPGAEGDGRTVVALRRSAWCALRFRADEVPGRHRALALDVDEPARFADEVVLHELAGPLADLDLARRSPQVTTSAAPLMYSWAVTAAATASRPSWLHIASRASLTPTDSRRATLAAIPSAARLGRTGPAARVWKTACGILPAGGHEIVALPPPGSGRTRSVARRARPRTTRGSREVGHSGPSARSPGRSEIERGGIRRSRRPRLLCAPSVARRGPHRGGAWAF